MSGRILKGMAYGLLLWVTGFVMGTVVFMIPALRAVAPIPGLTLNPAISVLAIMAWLIVTPVLARKYVAGQPDPPREGLRLGVLAMGTNLALDYAVLGVAMDNGPGFFGYAAIWIGYGVLLAVPVLVGRRTR